ncbi:transcriptional regulator with HTH domain and aminotransferase domain [Beggiatoa alba B18LD]|uniref:Transcriptional regulator with HTH domain and aminotransferase domain n=1 Tax=Beggiatoa alba B18LD TaxID=395493 RepID=I3CC10_9GAMM|nr:PLP-dependent aminotransferase family protein [Beggiatoa alba]EIJ41153.1 transcriptional regulator with HTH domain and aminotransferase domain [Beggiatoa alba B18LD]
MNSLFADRMQSAHRSFIREILKVTENPEIISFAGGLPNPRFFPVEPIIAATAKVMQDKVANPLQYSTTEGYTPLREYIAQRYAKRHGLKVHPDEILITNGSQQGLDLIGKIFLNKGDFVALEKPSYLGAIQAFSLYEPQFHTATLQADGIDTEQLAILLAQQPTKLFYTVPNFQNPSGITYSEAKRRALATVFQAQQTLVVEDDPYGELRFIGEDLAPLKSYLGDQAILLGSFSKIVAPGLRLGWICANREIIDKLVIAKQATDLQSNTLSQRLVYQYVTDNDLDEHIATIKHHYGQQRDLMVTAIEQNFPPEVTYTRPEGGMFLWVTLPPSLSAMDLFDYAAKANVAFVPGKAFYVDGSGNNTLRLNFSNADAQMIEEGIKRLGSAIKQLLLERTACAA